MYKVTITQAAKMAKISRSYFYKKYVTTGEISVISENNKKFIDVSELIRVFGSIQLEDTSSTQQDASKNTPDVISKDKIIQLLETQLAEAKEREKWLKEQLEKTTLMLENKAPKKRKKFFGIF